MDIKTLSIDNIGLSNRASNVLRRAGAVTVGDILEYKEEELANMRNSGKKTVEEILAKIEEIKSSVDETDTDAIDMLGEYLGRDIQSINFDEWIREPSGRNYVLDWLKRKKWRIDVVEMLSAKAYNMLIINGYEYLYQIVSMEEDELMQIPRMESAYVSEIIRTCRYFLKDFSEAILNDYAAEQEKNVTSTAPKLSISEALSKPRYHDAVLRYVRANDKDLCQLCLSNRPLNRLLDHGLRKMSDIIFMTKSQLNNFPNMGTTSVNEIASKINEYISTNENRLIAVCTGDDTALFNDDIIREQILRLYEEIGFGGLSFNEMKERLKLPEAVADERLKKIIGELLAEKELEYVDFRCYRIYGRFADYLERCPNIDERSKDFIRKRLQGKTLEEIAGEYGVTRERVRQVVKKSAQKVCDWYTMSTGNIWFDEDYYRYFYGAYAFEKKDAMEWLGMTADICNYLDMMDVKRGQKDLQAALEDYTGLETGLRLKVKNYLNRNKILVDGAWVEKRRSALEEVVVRKFCQENVSFDEFVKLYNGFLEQEEIPYNEDIYFTEAVLRTRKARLSDDLFLLWKQNEQIRYYDIEGRDFTELLDTLNLEGYENIDLSAMKFMEDYPDIMAKYDIRDHYELHNLLRKIVPEGSYHDFHCGRMPMLKFGSFDRDKALFDILVENAPISLTELCALIHDEYGYDPTVIAANYLSSFEVYYHQGLYKIDQKKMSAEHKLRLESELKDDFYYIDEIRTIYSRLFPDADTEEINSYTLKQMGFEILSRYVFRNYPSLEAYFIELLTKEEITDITPYRKRFTYVQTFSEVVTDLKKNLRIIEFEPNQFINFRRLERSEVTRDMVQSFCDAVYDFVDDGTYFSIKSLKQDGFESEIYDLGFSDWFYANLLISDDRFSYGQMFGNIILYKGNENIMTKFFEMSLIREHGSIDTYDLVSELEDRYGCKIREHKDVVYKLQGTEVYYDSIMDRLYASYDVYDLELDKTEGV